MVWEEVEPIVKSIVQKRGKPDVILIHGGGNSIGTMPLARLQKFMKLTFANLQTFLPQTRFIWSQILPRRYYRHMFSNIAADKARKRINKSLAPFVIARNGAYIKYPGLQQCSSTFYRDGTHLSDIAQVTFLNTIRDGLLSIIQRNARIFP